MVRSVANMGWLTVGGVRGGVSGVGSAGGESQKAARAGALVILILRLILVVEIAACMRAGVYDTNDLATLLGVCLHQDRQGNESHGHRTRLLSLRPPAGQVSAGRHRHLS